MANYYVEVYDEGTQLYEPITGFDVNHPDQVVWQASEELTEDEAHNRYDELLKARPDRKFKLTKIKVTRGI